MPQPADRGPPHGPSVIYNGSQQFAPSDRMTGTELYAFFRVPANHRLFLEAPGSEPDVRIANDGTAHDVKNGQHYYDLPEGQFGGTMLPRVEKELADLKAQYGPDNVQAKELPDGSLEVQILGVKLPPGWTRNETVLRFVVPPGYPQARPQGLQTSLDVSLAGGRGIGSGGGEMQAPDGTRWRNYCWQPKTWDMSRETLLRYAKFAESRFTDPV